MSGKTDSESIKKNLLMVSLVSGVSALALLTSAPAFAQEDPEGDQTEETTVDEEERDVIQVRGIRRSLENAQAIKRDADTFVDAVTSEDIGALPDRSVTEALQRVPGVQISRFAAADDPDHFSIEGQGVLVRGLTYVNSQLNGRTTFSANNGRALSFSDVPPELLSSVQVFKNQTADQIEGGIAGSVDLVTRKPLDQKETLFAGSLEYVYADFREEWSPTVSGLASKTWETPNGDFGILINGVYSDLKTRSDGTQISSFQPRDFGSGTVYAPEGSAIRSQDYDRERFGFGGSAQWESLDGDHLATFEFLRSEATTSWGEHVSEIATDNVGDQAFFFLPGTEFGFGSDGLFTNGSISAPLGWRSDQNSDPRTPIYGLQSNNIRRTVEQEYVTSDYSFNYKWTPTDKWALNFDYQFVDSTVSNIDFGLWGSTFQDIRLDTRQDIPDVVYLFPNETGGGGNPPYDCSNGVSNNCPSYLDSPNDSFADPYNTFWRSAMDHLEDSEGTQNAFRADAEYDFDDDGETWLKSVRFGGRYASRDQTTRFSTYNWGALSEIWGNGGPVWMDEVGAPEGVVEVFTWDNFQRGEVTQPPAFPFYSVNPAQNYGATADFADSVIAQWLANGGVTSDGNAWMRLSERPGVIAGTPYLPGEVADIKEDSTAFYAMMNFGHDNPFGNGITIDGNFGLRYVKTELESVGSVTYEFQEFPVTTGQPVSNDPNIVGGENRCVDPIPDPANPPTEPYSPPSFCALSAPEQQRWRDFFNGASEASVANNEYENWLPSVNVKIGLAEDKIIRLAYSKAISRPDVGLLRNNFTWTPTTGDPTTPTDDNLNGFTGEAYVGPRTSSGNPFLQPVESSQYDASFEWYFADVGSLTFSAFYKEIENIIGNGAGTFSATNNGVTFDTAFLTGPNNSDQTGKIKGFEVAYQQFYDMLPEPLNNFGINATYTYIDSDGVQVDPVNPTTASPGASSPLVDTASLPLEGLSEHNFNGALIYETDKISTRLAYNWRSEYLVTTRDVITPFYPIFQNASGQLDGSFFYTINENFKIGVQGANLLDEVTETTSFLPNSGGLKGPRSYFRNDRRITLSLRASF